ncbi:MAG: FAD-dependent oxidoreductase, partial [Clostridia bacterium]|nr:FAD-dependent oxidoreductase [Clostridia bacterium]
YAVIQLRQENAEKTMYNLVGFQTHLTFEAQKRVFRMIPGLENAEFLRYGVMHRNTYLNSPKLLSPDYSLRSDPKIFFAGQMTGVEGYIESTSSGWLAGINAARRVLGKEPFLPEAVTVIGALSHYVSDENVASFQPMNANFGLVVPLGRKVKGGKTARNLAIAERSLAYLDEIRAAL